MAKNTNLKDITDSVDNVTAINSWTHHQIQWVNDDTQLNAYNMNKIAGGITELQDKFKAHSVSATRSTQLIAGNNAGWKSAHSDTAEAFNDYVNNMAVAPYSHAEGFDTVSGFRSYRVGAVDQLNNRMWIIHKGDTTTKEMVTDSNTAHEFETYGGVSYPDFDYEITNDETKDKFFCFIHTSDGITHVIYGSVTGKDGNMIKYMPDSTVDTSRLVDEQDKSIVTKIHLVMCNNPVPKDSNMFDTIGNYSHAEGYMSHSVGNYSHSEGYATHSVGHSSHAEGDSTEAIGPASHAEGGSSSAIEYYSHAEGEGTKASSRCAHSEGYFTNAMEPASHASGLFTVAKASGQVVQGRANDYTSIDPEQYAHIVGNGEVSYDKTKKTYEVESRSNAYTLDWNGNAWYLGDVTSERLLSRRECVGSTVIAGRLDEENNVVVDGEVHAKNIVLSEGGDIQVHVTGGVEGIGTLNDRLWKVESTAANLVGQNGDDYKTNSMYGIRSLIQDVDDKLKESINDKLDAKDAVGEFQVSPEGTGEVFNDYMKNSAPFKYAHAEGEGTWALGRCAHAEGYYTRAIYPASHASGLFTVAGATGQVVQGRANDDDLINLENYAHIVGNGIVNYAKDSDTYVADKKSNAYTLDWNGNGWYAGNLLLGSGKSIYINCATPENMNYRVPIIYTGKEAPNSDTPGEEGDIYIRYNEVIPNEVLGVV